MMSAYATQGGHNNDNNNDTIIIIIIIIIIPNTSSQLTAIIIWPPYGTGQAYFHPVVSSSSFFLAYS